MSKRFKSSCGKSDAFLLSMGPLLGGTQRRRIATRENVECWAAGPCLLDRARRREHVGRRRHFAPARLTPRFRLRVDAPKFALIVLVDLGGAPSVLGLEKASSAGARQHCPPGEIC